MKSYEKSMEHSWSNKYIFPFYLSSTKKDNFLMFSVISLVFKSNMEIILRVMETKNIASITIIRIFKYINIYIYIYISININKYQPILLQCYNYQIYKQRFFLQFKILTFCTQYFTITEMGIL